MTHSPLHNSGVLIIVPAALFCNLTRPPRHANYGGLWIENPDGAEKNADGGIADVL